MDSNTLRTSVDELYELVKARGRMTIEDAAKALGLSLPLVHSLVDFLVEEKIFGIEYKFTTPYVYFNQERGSQKVTQKFITKEDFFSKAKSRGIPLERISELWRKYLGENLVAIRAQFYEKSSQKNIPKERINQLWAQYMEQLR